MIRIDKSETADTRTCDFTKVTKETLLASSHQHIRDVHEALQFFSRMLAVALLAHDTDKISDIDGFHEDFLTGFKKTEWWDRHRKLNLIDVLDFISDCVMAGMARSGSVYPLQLPAELLERAFQNTVALLKAEVVVNEPVLVPAETEPKKG